MLSLTFGTPPSSPLLVNVVYGYPLTVTNERGEGIQSGELEDTLLRVEFLTCQHFMLLYNPYTMPVSDLSYPSNNFNHLGPIYLQNTRLKPLFRNTLFI